MATSVSSAVVSALPPPAPPQPPAPSAPPSVPASSSVGGKHSSISDRFKDRISKFRHREQRDGPPVSIATKTAALQPELPPSPAALTRTPESPAVSSGTTVTPQPTQAANALKPSTSSVFPASSTASVPLYTATLNLPPAGASSSAGKRDGRPPQHMLRSYSSSPTMSPHSSPRPSPNALMPQPVPSYSVSPSAPSATPSPSLLSLSLPAPAFLTGPGRPVVGALHIRIVEGRNLGPASARSMRTHLLCCFESAFSRSASFPGPNPFYGHSVWLEVTDCSNDVVVQLMEEHKLTKDAALGQVIVSLSSLLQRDPHPLARHFSMDEWIELLPCNYDEGPNALFYHKYPSNEHRITGAGMRKPQRWPIGQLHLKLELQLHFPVSICYLISSAQRHRKPVEKKRKELKEADKAAAAAAAGVPVQTQAAGADVLDPPTPGPRDVSSAEAERPAAPEFHGATFKRNFRRLQRIYASPAHWLYYARLCQQWESPPLSLLSLLVLYALCFNTKPHHVPLLLFAAVFLIGLASHARTDDSDIITFDTEAIPSEWLKEGALHKLRRWRGVLGRASYVLGMVASRLEQISAAFNWSDAHLSLLVYGLLLAVTGSLSLLFYFVPVGVVVMAVGLAVMADGLLSALGRWELDWAMLDKMRRANEEIEARRSRRAAVAAAAITVTSPQLMPHTTEADSATSQDLSPDVQPAAAAAAASVPAASSVTTVVPSSSSSAASDAGPVPSGRSSGSGTRTGGISSQLAQVYTSMAGTDASLKREEMKRAGEAAAAASASTHRPFFRLRRRVKTAGSSGSQAMEKQIVTSYDDQALVAPRVPSSSSPITPPPAYRPRTSSMDSASRPALAVTPDSSDSASPRAESRPVTPRLPAASPIHPSSSWPLSLSETRLTAIVPASSPDESEQTLSASSSPDGEYVHPWLLLLPSRAAVHSCAMGLLHLLPVLADVLKLLLLYLRMAVRHLASRAPDQLEIAHRVISERAMRDPSVADSHTAVEKKLSAREAKRELKRKQKAAAAAAKAKGAGHHSHHNAITTQIAQVYSSFQRARSHASHAQQQLPPAPVATAAVSAHGPASAASSASSFIAASSVPPASVALPSLPAAAAAVQRGESSVRLLSVDASPLSPVSVDGGSARWEDGEDSSDLDSEQDDSDGEMDSDSAED